MRKCPKCGYPMENEKECWFCAWLANIEGLK